MIIYPWIENNQLSTMKWKLTSNKSSTNYKFKIFKTMKPALPKTDRNMIKMMVTGSKWRTILRRLGNPTTKSYTKMINKIMNRWKRERWTIFSNKSNWKANANKVSKIKIWINNLRIWNNHKAKTEREWREILVRSTILMKIISSQKKAIMISRTTMGLIHNWIKQNWKKAKQNWKRTKQNSMKQQKRKQMKRK